METMNTTREEIDAKIAAAEERQRQLELDEARLAEERRESDKKVQEAMAALAASRGEPAPQDNPSEVPDWWGFIPPAPAPEDVAAMHQAAHPDHSIVGNLDAEEKSKGKEKKEKKPKEEFDAVAAAERVRKQIEALPPEEQKRKALELFRAERQAFNEKHEGKFAKYFKKFDSSWDNLDKTKGGIALKALINGALVTVPAVFIAPTSLTSIGIRLTARVAAATGLNTVLTSNTVQKLFASSEKEGGTENKSSKLKNTVKGLAVVGGAAAGFWLGGWAVAAIGLGGAAVREGATYIYKNKVQKLEAKRKALSLSQITFDDTLDIKAVAHNLNKIAADHEEIAAELRTAKWIQKLATGATTLAAGLGTVAVTPHHVHEGVAGGPKSGNASTETPPVTARSGTTTTPEHHDTSSPIVQNTPPTTPSPVEQHVTAPTPTPAEHVTPATTPVEHPVVPPVAPLENADPLELATVRGGHGIEHVLIKQIEHDPELAKNLGYKEGTNLRAFAEMKAHKISIDNKYFDEATGKSRIVPDDKLAFKLTYENGHPKVEEIKLGTHDTAAGHIEPKSPEAPLDHAKATEHLKETAEATAAGKASHPAGTSVEVEAPRTEEIVRADLHAAYEDRPHNPYSVRMGTEVHMGTEIRTGEPMQIGRGGPVPLYNEQINVHSGDNAIPHIAATHDAHGTLSILAPEDRDTLVRHPAFLRNPYDLPGPKLLEVYEASKKHVEMLFQSRHSLAWYKLKDMSAGRMLGWTDTAGQHTENGVLSTYMRLLQAETYERGRPIEPKFLWSRMRSENAEEFIARAMQNIQKHGELDNFMTKMKELEQ